MGGNGIAGQSGLSTWITYHRSKQRNGRAAGASTQGSGSAAATESRATSFHSQGRGGPFSACRRSCAIRRRIAASRVARVTIPATELAVDRQIEHGEVPSAAFDLEFGPDRPDVFGRSGGFAPVTLPLFQGTRLWGVGVAFT